MPPMVACEQPSAVAEGVTRLAQTRGVREDQLQGVVGTPEQSVEQLLPYVEAGVGDLILMARMPAGCRSLETMATRAAPMLRDAT